MRNKENKIMEFHDTMYGKRFFENQLPSLIRALNRIADNQESGLSGKSMGQSSRSNVVTDSTSKIYVCYEENSIALYSEAGNISKLFVTSDEALAKEWAKRSYEMAAGSGYHPIEEADYAELMDHIGDTYASMWVYLGRRENSRENYGICVDCFDLSKSEETLERLFS